MNIQTESNLTKIYTRLKDQWPGINLDAILSEWNLRHVQESKGFLADCLRDLIAVHVAISPPKYSHLHAIARQKPKSGPLLDSVFDRPAFVINSENTIIFKGNYPECIEYIHDHRPGVYLAYPKSEHTPPKVELDTEAKRRGALTGLEKMHGRANLDEYGIPSDPEKLEKHHLTTCYRFWMDGYFDNTLVESKG